MASPIHKPPALRVDNIRQWNWANHFPHLDGPDAPLPPWVAHWTKKMMLDRITQKATDTMKANKRGKTKRKKVEKPTFFRGKEKGKGKKEEKKIVDLDSSSEEDTFSESKSESESDKTPPAKRTRQQREEEEIEKIATKKRKQPQKVVKKESKKRKTVPMDSESTCESESQEKEIEKTPIVKRKQPERVAKKQTKSGKLVLIDSESKTKSEKKTEQVKDNTEERRRQALQMLREKRSKLRNDGAQTTNVAPDRFDSTEARNDFSETFPIAVSLPSSLKEELMKDDFIYGPSESQTQETSVNDSPLEPQQQPCEEALCPLEPEKQAAEESSPRMTKPEPPLNVSPPEEQQQPCQKALMARQLEEEAQPDFCLPEPKKQAGKGSFRRKTEPEHPLNVAVGPSLWQHDAPSFDLGISPPTSQPTPPTSQPTVSQLEVLADAVVDAGVTAALKFAEATSAELTFTTAEVYKIAEKEKEITEELKEKCYHWITHVKETKDSTNEYDPLFILKHQGNFEGLRHHFMSLMPGQHVRSTMFILENHGEKYIDPKTKKAYRFDVDRYAHYCQFLDKRKLASHLFALIVSQMRVYNGAEPLMEDRDGEEAKYIRLDGQTYDCTIYILKWLETIDPQKIKSGKRYQYKAWTQEEIDAFRLEYDPNILLHKLNKIRDQVIRTSEAIRLPKPFVALSRPYCKFTSGDIYSK
ncbi:uncharacterized protein DS421_17g580440 [Arachis hypogaea]|nr:uncharacterized protein DS421_17g580440 [Arachis hypogaea]